ncbi:hypothetical protein FGO68_gene8978 [Halteria grandinella]|uniref:Uncharacterized protein n=1 Tax=Halteria grandinella TaxID=5974 RepID=A0A8J8NWX0_HALGN|nr:hypothetical protein FGO68_gene8978 [Halteria grandinella]
MSHQLQQLLMRASLDFNSSPLLDLKLPTELPPINHQRRRRSVLQRLNQQTVVKQPINTDKLSLEKEPSLEDFTK